MIVLTLLLAGMMEVSTARFDDDARVYPLEGEVLLVRFYSPETGPTAYTTAEVPIQHGTVRLDPATVPEGGVAVAIGYEQSDPVAKQIGDVIWTLSPDKEAHGFNVYETRTPITILITDAEGKPVPDAAFHLLLGTHPEKWGALVELEQWQTDESGRIAIPSVEGWLHILMSARVEHPNYGQAVAALQVLEEGNSYALPLLPEDSPARDRALKGTVIDPDGNPISGATVTCSHIRTLGQGLIQPVSERASVVTGPDGRFLLYPHVRDLKDEWGDLIPPKSTYHFRVDAPKSLGLFIYMGAERSDAEITVRMEKGHLFHTFAYEDTEGNVVVPNERSSLSIQLERSGGQCTIPIHSELLRKGGFLVQGTLTGWLIDQHSPGRTLFEPIQVTENSPEQLVFRPVQPITYRGAVEHAVTGQPMAGAYILAMTAIAQGNLAQLTSTDWDALDTLPAAPAPDDERLEPVRKHFEFAALVRTDGAGEFTLAAPPGRDVYSLIVFAKDFVPVACRVLEASPDHGMVETPVMPLVPAATVSLQVQTEEPHLAVCPQWLVDKEHCPEWAVDLIPGGTCCGEKLDFQYDNWLPINELVAVHVPADIPLQLQLRTPYAEEWASLTLPRSLELSQGQHADLGAYQLSPSTEIRVRVTTPEGNPVEGIPVRKLVDNVGSVAHVTDADGYVRFFVEPSSQGEFTISYHDVGLEDEDGGSTLAAVAFDMQSKGAADTERTLHLTEQHVQRIFSAANSH